MLKRLIEFYIRHGELQPEDTTTIWKGVLDGYQQELITALLARNEQRLGEVFEQLYPKSGLYGIDLEDNDDWALNLLGQRIGLVPYKNPEQPSAGENWRSKDFGTLLNWIENCLGMSLAVPICFGFKEKVPVRFYFYCAAWFTLHNWFWSSPPKHVLEIGAGLCNLGLICSRQNVDTYTVIDLPSVAVMGAYFMEKCVGGEKIGLSGETDAAEKPVRFFTNHTYLDAADRKYDLIFNSDSFPEIPVAVQNRYVDFIANNLAEDGVFHSINHESDNMGQRRVREALQGALKCVYRAPFMMRAGYVEEIYRHG